MKPLSGGGLLLLRRTTPLARRNTVYFCSGAYTPPEELNDLSPERQRIVREVSRLSRAADFRQRVLFAYGHRCAVSRVQLKLVDAAHILPVGAPGSSDHVRNGIALSPTYHRAFDAGLIYLDGQCRMLFNDDNLRALRRLGLEGGADTFRAGLGDGRPLPYQRFLPIQQLQRRLNGDTPASPNGEQIPPPA